MNDTPETEETETEESNNEETTPNPEGARWEATIREKVRVVETPSGPVRLGGRTIGTFRQGDSFPQEGSEVTIAEIVIETQEGIAGSTSQVPVKVRLSNGREILKAGAADNEALIDQNPPDVNPDDPTLPTGPTGGSDLDDSLPGSSNESPSEEDGPSSENPLPVVATEGDITWVEITVNNVRYQVGTDYVRTGNVYSTFSGNIAREYARSRNWIVPTREIAQAIGDRARKIRMPTQNQFDSSRSDYKGPNGDETLHTQQILQLTGGEFPTDFVVGHKKDVIQGNGVGTCLWGGWKGDGWWQQGGCPHGGNYRDYSQGLRPVRRVRTT